MKRAEVSQTLPCVGPGQFAHDDDQKGDSAKDKANSAIRGQHPRGNLNQRMHSRVRPASA